ncbi:hypothetical protein K458DRAFT_377328 [Lentithecium fluviatile CBS 122367]|uniref:Heterokaryon incompatibility domain-containing protein n=1 Tax=Lentithecium fluviatile CBS 122367 TaxID=1168545 RepID=A0A6G1IIP3_9PLEO|nr:hypothetical protein K458DRAFT_377328 [Lentithecium fluviatile CBS 122367]
MGLVAPDASSSMSSKLARYRPKELAPPILPEPTREDFIDSRSRLQQIVSDEFITPGGLSRKYRYTPLKEKEIRLLLIEPGNPDSELRCDMIYGRLDDPLIYQRYHALSYHWGFDKATNRITIMDDRLQRSGRVLLSEKNKFASLVSQMPAANQTANNEWWFPVRDNLLSALRGLRQQDEPLLLWVDAICINQDPADEEAKKEKQQQVNNMAQIYNSANSVCIWLGEGTTETDQAMEFIEKVVTDIPDLDKYFTSGKEQWRDWLALRDLLTFKWFSRRWVVQEVALARDATVHCGTKSINWDDFADGVALFVDKMERVNRAHLWHMEDPSKLEDVAALGANSLVTTLSNLSRKSENGDILERLVGIETLVSSLLFFEASNPHDYIYSLLALARDTAHCACPNAQSSSGSSINTFDIEVKYDKAPLEVFKNFTEQCVRASKSLDIICRHWAPSEVEGKDEEGVIKEVAFPSWILKVSQSSYGTAQDTLQGRRGGDSLVGCPYRDMRKTYNACNGTEAICSFGEPFPECPLRSFTDLSDASHDSLSTKRIDLSGTFSRKPTLNELARHGMEERDFADVGNFMSGALPVVEPNELEKRKDGGTFQRPPSTRHGSNTSLRSEVSYFHVLYVMGVQLGRIKQHSTRITNGTVPAEWLEATGWQRRKPGRVPDMLWRTLVADRGPEGQFPPRWYRRACSHCLSDKNVMTTNADLDTQKTPSSNIMAKFLTRVKSVVFNRQFFAGGSPERPLFGLAPKRAEKGDLVCVLAGCTVPVILRKRKGPDGSCHFELIGEAYVHGNMDGEAMSGLSSNAEDLKKELMCFPLV